LSAMTRYGKWVVGVEPRDSKVKYVSGDTPLTAPQRLDYIRKRQAEIEELEKRGRAGLGNGEGIELGRVKDAKAVGSLARAGLIADADAFLQELKAEAFAAIRDARFARSAPKPSDVVGKNDKMFEELFPPATPPNPISFEALPPTLRLTWDQYYTA